MNEYNVNQQKLNFNSIKVRLEHYEAAIAEANFSISIP